MEITGKVEEQYVAKVRRGRPKKVEIITDVRALPHIALTGFSSEELSESKSKSKKLRSEKDETSTITKASESTSRTRSKKLESQSQPAGQNVSKDDSAFQNDSTKTKKRNFQGNIKLTSDKFGSEGEKTLPSEELDILDNEEVTSRKKQKPSRKSMKKEDFDEASYKPITRKTSKEPRRQVRRTRKDFTALKVDPGNNSTDEIEKTKKVIPERSKIPRTSKNSKKEKETLSKTTIIEHNTKSLKIIPETAIKPSKVNTIKKTSSKPLKETMVTKASEITFEPLPTPINSTTNRNQSISTYESSKVGRLEEFTVVMVSADLNTEMKSSYEDIKMDNAEITSAIKSSIDKEAFDKAKTSNSDHAKEKDANSHSTRRRKSTTKKMDSLEDEENEKVDIYAIFEIPKTANLSEIKRAYHKVALKLHPDKLAGTLKTDQEREEATKKFQKILLYNVILSDDVKRARYDVTGVIEKEWANENEHTTESEWNEYFRELWSGKVTAESITEYEKNFKGSEEQKRDIIAAYNHSQGSMDFILSSVIATSAEDEEFIINIIETAIANSEIKLLKNFLTSTSSSQHNQRCKEAAEEAKEAEKAQKGFSTLGDPTLQSSEDRALQAKIVQQSHESNPKKRKYEAAGNEDEATPKKSRKNSPPSTSQPRRASARRAKGDLARQPTANMSKAVLAEPKFAQSHAKCN
ncbi:hypothetical protein HK096_001253 [Nowakowskiella sp. JEL0078]|nr:hypothetical protein HK096_001253 [Nowakowskiella sp. JEL0078]